MGIFQKSGKRAAAADNLPQYVDGLLDAAELDSIKESDPLIIHPVEYGIEKATQLLHLLLQKSPQDAALVMSVVRETLKSANIDVDLVVQDAQTKAQRMQDSIAALTAEISLLKTQIGQKETEIVQTETALRETRRVQELLQHKAQAGKAAVVELVALNSANY